MYLPYVNKSGVFRPVERRLRIVSLYLSLYESERESVFSFRNRFLNLRHLFLQILFLQTIGYVTQSLWTSPHTELEGDRTSIQ